MEFVFDNEVLQGINANVDLLEYVSQTIDLKKRGKDYFGRCPLHVDKTPSFSITPSKNSYYCFSCGRSGGIIGFLIDYEGLKFSEAVNKAAMLADMDLSTMCHSKTISYLKNIKNAKSINSKPIFKHEIIPTFKFERYSREPVTEWLNEGISQETLTQFDIRIDKGQNRIVYPVYDIDGNLINIKGRTRYENYKQLGIPKYMNYFPVEVADYFQSLNMTLPYVKEKNEIIIFESIKSVMKAWDWGYKNCASAEKHTLTDEQILLLIRLKTNIVFAYDADVNYKKQERVKENLDILKRITNVYIVKNKDNLLGKPDEKNAPVDLGEGIWKELYLNKKKVV